MADAYMPIEDYVDPRCEEMLSLMSEGDAALCRGLQYRDQFQEVVDDLSLGGAGWLRRAAYIYAFLELKFGSSVAEEFGDDLADMFI